MKLIDISLTISEDLPIWPGDPRPQLTKISLISEGEDANVTHLSSCVHIGTHVDAPDHFLGNGRTVVDIPLELMIGKTRVSEISSDGPITESDLRAAGVDGSQKRLLIKTKNSDLWKEGIKEFQRNFIALDASAAEYLVKMGVEVIGVDYLSVAPYADPAPTHRILLEAGILIIEGLNLSQVEGGEYMLFCLPLKIEGSDGAPARVLLQAD